ncbi:MAG TPA: hypothetical protein VNF69_15590 [Burkholderiales bacterium]|nr:hypothetical protein [Burkholderiales bacterium]
MSLNSTPSTETLKAFEGACESASRSVRQAGSMREAIEVSAVTEPHDLQGIGRMLPGYRRVLRALANRLGELLVSQLEVASRIREPYNLERELDHLKVHEWYVLRTDYPELYAKGITEAAQLRRRIQPRR